MKKLQIFALLLAMISLVSFGCKRDDIQPESNSNPGEPGTFKAYMTDSPGDYEALDVEILRVEAYLDGQGWVVLNNDAHVVNVLSLTNGVQTELTANSNAQAQFGTYSKLKIVFGGSNRLKLNHQAALAIGGLELGSDGMVELGYEGEREIIIEIDQTVNANSGAYVLIDFNVAQSIIQNGSSFVMRPVITVIHRVRNGVRGHVNGAASVAITLSNEAESFSTYANAQGDFLIRGMAEGMYTLTALPGRAAGELDEPEPQSIEGVVVVDGKITSVGNINF